MKLGSSIGIFLNSANLICRNTDISKCFRGSLRLQVTRVDCTLFYHILFLLFINPFIYLFIFFYFLSFFFIFFIIILFSVLSFRSLNLFIYFIIFRLFINMFINLFLLLHFFLSLTVSSRPLSFFFFFIWLFFFRSSFYKLFYFVLFT